MGFLSRFRRERERPQTARAPEAPRTHAEAEERIIEIAQRTVPPAEELVHFFVVSGNPSVIEAGHGSFRVGAPTYGGSARRYRADSGALAARVEEAATGQLSFGGQSALGTTLSEVESLAEALQITRRETAGGEAHVAYVAVGPSGTDWVRAVYTTVLSEAVSQMILPFHMLVTRDRAAASALRESLDAAG